MLDEHIARAKERGDEGIGAEEAFRLHDTYGFPFDLTLELAAEQGLGVDAAGLRGPHGRAAPRARASAGARRRATATASASRAFADAARRRRRRSRATSGSSRRPRSARSTRRTAGCSPSSSSRPFYATGGGQIADAGVIECEYGDCRARVVDVVRARRRPGARARARAGRAARGRARGRARRPGAPAPDAGQPHGDAPAARGAARARSAPTCARPAPTSGRTSCASTSRTASRCRAEERARRRGPGQRAGSSPTSRSARSRRRSTRRARSARWRCSARSTATSCAWSRSATARWSRELCGGTHVRSTAEIGVFRITTETSSAANVRRIEAITGPAAVELLRDHDRVLGEAAAAAADVARERRRGGRRPRGASGASSRSSARARRRPAPTRVARTRPSEVDGVQVLVEQAEVGDAKAMLDVADRCAASSATRAVVLGSGRRRPRGAARRGERRARSSAA